MPQHRLQRLGDKAGVIGIRIPKAAVLEIGKQIFQYPAADDAVIGQDHKGAYYPCRPYKAPAWVDGFAGINGIEPGGTPHSHFCQQQRRTQQDQQDQIEDQKDGTSVAACNIWKLPEISQSDG